MSIGLPSPMSIFIFMQFLLLQFLQMRLFLLFLTELLHQYLYQ